MRGTSLLLLGALLAAPHLACAGFSDDELRGIYTQMRDAGTIRCGMTVEQFIMQYRGCAENSVHCEASVVTTGPSGPCVDRLTFEAGGGPMGRTDPSITLNGQSFPKPVPPPPEKTPKPNERKS
jgi:hypothetical protein